MPQPGEAGHETWLNDGWKGRSGTNVWAWQMTVDRQRGIVYMPIGGPASNYYGGDRPGANLFGNSVVAVDAETGKLKWYFQTVHHDLWDYDTPPAPVLLDITVNGKKIPAIAQIGKTGWMFILDRTNGKPVFGVEERKVTAGDVPGEWYSPTQPFPLKPPPLARMDYKPEDLVTAEDTTPEHAAACKALVEKSGGFYNTGPFTPFLLHDGWHAAEIEHHFSRRHGRHQLGRHGRGSEGWIHLRLYAGPGSGGLDGEEEAGRAVLIR